LDFGCESALFDFRRQSSQFLSKTRQFIPCESLVGFAPSSLFSPGKKSFDLGGGFSIALAFFQAVFQIQQYLAVLVPFACRLPAYRRDNNLSCNVVFLIDGMILPAVVDDVIVQEPRVGIIPGLADG